MTDTHCIQQAVQNRFQEKSETKQTSYINNTKKKVLLTSRLRVRSGHQSFSGSHSKLTQTNVSLGVGVILKICDNNSML